MYEVPKGAHLDYIKNHNPVTEKSPRICFVDEAAANKKFVPSPNKYQRPKLWCALGEDGAIRPKGAFMKNRRTTITEEAWVWSKKNKRPSQHAYEPLKCFNKFNEEPCGMVKQNGEKINFTDESAALSMETPGPKYKEIDIEVVKQRAEKWEIKRTKYVNHARLPKLNDPSPATYKPNKSFTNIKYSSAHANPKGFIDQYIGLKSWIPSPDAYKNIDNAYPRLSRSPHRSLRH